MKFFTSLTAIIAGASAGQIYTNQQPENYANAAELYQSQLEYQQHGLYSSQPQAYVSDAMYSHTSAEKAARIVSYLSENDGHSYQFSYETENGIKAQESGHDVGAGAAAAGVYSYVGPDGREYAVSYTADERGFRPQGAHLPTPPPIPDAIVKALEQNARDETAGVYDDGHYEEPKYSSAGYEPAGHVKRTVAQPSAYHKRSA